MWRINSASIIGRDHEFSKKNKQDFVCQYQSETVSIGVVCDGCGESQFSEVGSSLIGTFILNYFKLYSKNQCQPKCDDLKSYLESCLTDFIFHLQHSLLFRFIDSKKIDFIKDFLLTTCIFFVVYDKQAIVGHCGDGVVIINDDIRILNQNGSPHYIAYKAIPREQLQTDPTKLDFFKIELYDSSKINQILIGTDGIQPLIDRLLVKHLYGTQKRQLQRKFNIWQQEKLFGDDASCVIIEKETTCENDIPQEPKTPP
jgi:hypothetical protein